jgi:CMP-N-acetylneuraminic acid synthetase
MDFNKINIVAIIPARSGSKSVIDKNIRTINNKPLLAYSIEQARQSRYINRVIISTDSEKYRSIAMSYGAEAPFLRPAELSQDSSLDIDLFKHAYLWLKENEGYTTDIFVHLRPTHPIRDVKDIDKMICLLVNDKDADSIRSVSRTNETPYKMWFSKNSILSPVLSDIHEAYNMPRQSLPIAYSQNACIDVIKAKTIMKKNSMTGDKILGYEMSYNFDIDTEDDFLKAELFLTLTQNSSDKPFVVVCDIDGIIANKVIDNDYSKSTPNTKNINLINDLFDKGHQIDLFTARGYTTGINWEALTKNQLQNWGVKYSSLKFGKPNADFYIDDKFISLADLHKILTTLRRKE